MSRKVLTRSGKVKASKPREQRYLPVPQSEDEIAEYLSAFGMLVEELNAKWFEGTLLEGMRCDNVRIEIDEVLATPYEIETVLTDDGVVHSAIRLSGYFMRKHDANLGDRSYGMVHMFIRAVCEHMAKHYLREITVYRIRKEFRVIDSADVAVSMAAKVLRDIWGAKGEDEKPPLKEKSRIVSRSRAKCHIEGWFDVYRNLIHSICGTALSMDLPLAKEQDEVKGVYVLDRRTLMIHRVEKVPKEDGRRTKLKTTPKSVCVKLKTGDTVYETP